MDVSAEGSEASRFRELALARLHVRERVIHRPRDRAITFRFSQDPLRALDRLPDRRRTPREDRSDPRLDQGLFPQVSGVACVDQRGLEITLGVPELPVREPHL